jgi:hypothetical protein
MSGLLLILVAWSLPIQSGPDLFHTAPHSTGNAHPRPQPQAALTRSTAKGPFPRTATCRPGPRGRRPAEPLPAEAWLDRARGASCRPGFWTSRCPTPVSLLLPSSTRRKTSNGCGTCERVPTLRRQAGDVRGASSVRGVGLDLESPEDRLRSIRRNRATGPLRIRARIRIRQLPTESRIALPWPGCGLPGRSQATSHASTASYSTRAKNRTAGPGASSDRWAGGPRVGLFGLCGGRIAASLGPVEPDSTVLVFFIPRSPRETGRGASLRRWISARPNSMAAVASRRRGRRAWRPTSHRSAGSLRRQQEAGSGERIDWTEAATGFRSGGPVEVTASLRLAPERRPAGVRSEPDGGATQVSTYHGG